MTIQFYGGLKNYFDSELRVENSSISNGSELINFLIKQAPAAEQILNICSIAINQEIVALNHLVTDKDEIALLPPFSGG